jgi:hypothetical protein
MSHHITLNVECRITVPVTADTQADAEHIARLEVRERLASVGAVAVETRVDSDEFTHF